MSDVASTERERNATAQLKLRSHLRRLLGTDSEALLAVYFLHDGGVTVHDWYYAIDEWDRQRWRQRADVPPTWEYLLAVAVESAVRRDRANRQAQCGRILMESGDFKKSVVAMIEEEEAQTMKEMKEEVSRR